MSRIGKLQIPIPAGVEVKLADGALIVKGPRGELHRAIHPDIGVARDGDALVVTRQSDEKVHRGLHGLTRALVANMVTGVTTGFERALDVVGTGYRAEQDGNVLVLYVGYSHPLRFDPPSGVSIAVEERGKRVIVRGTDKEAVGAMAVKIRGARPPEPYKGKGVHYVGEHVRRKAGKAGKVGK